VRFAGEPAGSAPCAWPAAVAAAKRAAAHRTIVGGRRGFGVPQEGTMSHQPPKESKKKPQHTPKEKKAIKQQKKHTGDVVPFIKA